MICNVWKCVILALVSILCFTTLAENQPMDSFYQEVLSCFSDFMDIDELQFSDKLGVPLKSRTDLTCELEHGTAKFGGLSIRTSPWQLDMYYSGIIYLDILQNTPQINLPFGLEIGMTRADVTQLLNNVLCDTERITTNREIQLSSEGIYTNSQMLSCKLLVRIALTFDDNMLSECIVELQPSIGW